MGENEHAGRDGIVLLDVLEIVDNFLVFNQLCNCFYVLNTVIFDLSSVHLGFIANNSRAIHGLKKTWFQLVGVIVFSGLESHLAQSMSGEKEIDLERHDLRNESLKFLSLLIFKSRKVNVQMTNWSAFGQSCVNLTDQV